MRNTINIMLRIAVSIALICLWQICKSQTVNDDVKKVDQLIGQAKTLLLKDTVETKSLLFKALSAANSIKNDTCLANIYAAFGEMYKVRGLDKQSSMFFQKQLDASTHSKSDYHIATALKNIADVQTLKGQNRLAIETSTKALGLFRKLKEKKKESMMLGMISISYMVMGEYIEATDYQLKALKIAEEINGKKEIAYSQFILSLIYKRTKNYEKGIEYSYKALRYYEEVKDEPNIASLLFNIAINQGMLKDYDNAKKNVEKVIPFFERLKKGVALAQCYILLKDIADLVDNEKDSEKYLQLALKYSALNGNPYNDSDWYLNKSKLDLLQKKYTEAEGNLKSALAIATKANLVMEISNIQRQLAVVYMKNGQGMKASKMLNRYDDFRDSLLRTESLAKINELQTKYETSKKEAQIFLLNKENDIKALQLNNNALEISKNKSLLTTQQQQITINGLELSNKNQALANQKLDAQKKTQDIKALQKQSRIQNLELANKKLELEQRNLAMGSILVVFLALGGISFSFYKRNQLKQQNLLQTEIYKQQEIATKSVFEGEQNERIRIARDLHDGIGQMLSVVKMNVSTLNPSDKTVEGTLSLVDKTITELRAISHNLIPEALNFGLFAALEDICKKINEAGKTQVDLNVAQEMDEVPLTQQNKLSIYRIVQEVLNNMIKHANASHISIDIKKANENMLIAIKDDGDGFDASKIDDSKGIGWKNISARVHLMDGDMNIKSEKLIGTQIEISIPA